MRIVLVFLLAGVVLAQAPVTFKPKPVGNLKQVMRSILLPNSDLIFGVQQTAPKDDAGWSNVANAAVAIGESAALITMPGRMLSDGQPVPVAKPGWLKFSQALVDASKATLKAAQSKNAEAVGNSTDGLSAACDNCHQVYRDKPAK